MWGESLQQRRLDVLAKIEINKDMEWSVSIWKRACNQKLVDWYLHRNRIEMLVTWFSIHHNVHLHFPLHGRTFKL